MESLHVCYVAWFKIWENWSLVHLELKKYIAQVTGVWSWYKMAEHADNGSEQDDISFLRTVSTRTLGTD